MTDPEQSEPTTGGLMGKLAGKAKEAAGALSGNDDLAREGRLQQASVDAASDARAAAAQARQADAEASLQAEREQVETERARLQNEVAADQREDRIEAERHGAEERAETIAENEKATAERQREQQESAADRAKTQAERERIAAAEQSIRLEQQARQAEATASEIGSQGGRMNARTIPRVVIENSLTAVRIPIDAVIDRLPGNGTGVGPTVG